MLVIKSFSAYLGNREHMCSQAEVLAKPPSRDPLSATIIGTSVVHAKLN
jgi:hypothetical protein